MTRLIASIRNTRFLKQDDVDPALVVTIKCIKDENVGMDDTDKNIKAIVYFEELEPGLVLNWTNAQVIANICGSEDMDEWHGHRIEIYDDPTVMYAGKLVGGIRIRPARTPKETIHSDRPSVA